MKKRQTCLLKAFRNVLLSSGHTNCIHTQQFPTKLLSVIFFVLPWPASEHARKSQPRASISSPGLPPITRLSASGLSDPGLPRSSAGLPTARVRAASRSRPLPSCSCSLQLHRGSAYQTGNKDFRFLEPFCKCKISTA